MTSRPQTSLPTRLIGRLVAEMNLGCLVATLAAVRAATQRSVPVDRAIMLLLIIRGDARFRSVATGVATEPAPAMAGLSVNALSSSLGRPFETTRRHVNALIASGLVERRGGGIGIAGGDDPAALDGMLVRLHDLLVRLVETLHGHDLRFPEARDGTPYDPNATIATAIDLTLAAFAFFVPHFDDWGDTVIIGVTTIANARPVTFDPALAQRYAWADTVPPEAVRRPVTAAAIARCLGLPASTVRRRFDKAIRRGHLTHADGGVLVSETLLAGPVYADGGAAAAVRTGQFFERLRPGGFPFHDPASRYIIGRPPPVPFD